MQLPSLQSILYPLSAILIMMIMNGCDRYKKEKMQGYIDAKLFYASSLKSGELIVRSFYRGDKVQKGDILFELEEEPEKSALELGKENIVENKARLEDLKKGQRPSEIEAIEARIEQAEARHKLAALMWRRQQDLYEKQSIDKATVDAAKRELDESTALQEELKANLETAKLGSRIDLITAAQAQLEASEADLERLQWEYDQKIVKSPVNGTVFDYYYKVGENVPANKPVISILYPEEVKAIFYVSEPELSQLQLGQKIKILCDGCKDDLIGTITFISPVAEYTPPVIYSVDRRSELVFRVEASFDPKEVSTMHMGLPIEVQPIKQ